MIASSSHPSHIVKSIPFLLSLRIVYICSEKETRYKRLEELKQLLVNSDYDLQIIDNAIDKAKAIPRKSALKKVKRKNKITPPTFVNEFNPMLLDINNITKKHWRSSSIIDLYFK